MTASAPASDAPAVVTPGPVVCLVDDLHRDLTVARDAQSGRFTHLGRTLALGRRPDWRAGDPSDVEWRIEWVKLYEGLDVAHAYSVTGDPDLIATWEDLVESFCDQVPVDEDPTDVSARRVQNWLYAWQQLAAAPAYRGLRDGLAERLLARIRADVDHIAAHLTPERNHRTLELYTLLLAGLALGDLDGAKRALALLADNARSDIWPDGVHRECSSDYHLIVLRSLVGAVANARAAGLDVPAELLVRTHRGFDVALHLQRPDGLTPALSDGDVGDFRTLLARAAGILDRPDLRWAATGGAAGSPPADRLVSFPVGGYHVQRSGWGDGARAYEVERWCVLDCGPIGDGGHGHYDQLSVEMMADGSSLVVDPGRYTYAEDGAGWRHWFKGTAAHNTVCVDGTDQTPYRTGKPKGPVSTASLVGRSTAAGLDVIRGAVRSPQYDAVHTRTLAFVDEDYWVVHDRLRAASTHHYAARWHLAAAAAGRTYLGTEGGQSAVRCPAGVLVVPAGFGAVSLEDGWVSPSYGTKQAAPVAAVTSGGVADADLLTVLLPGSAAARVSAVRCGDALEVRVERAGTGVDTLRLAPEVDGCGWERTPC